MTMYKRLLHLYPNDFYRQFAHDMSLDFDAGYEVASRSGSWPVVSFVMRCYADLVGSLVSQWLRNESLIVSGMSVGVALAMWTVAFFVAAREWPNGPATSWFLWQIGIALTAGSVLTQSVLRINR
jgi:hypothetical protein